VVDVINPLVELKGFFVWGGLRNACYNPAGTPYLWLIVVTALAGMPLELQKNRNNPPLARAINQDVLICTSSYIGVARFGEVCSPQHTHA